MQAAWQSDIGKVRENNEDSILADQEQGLFLLADGMGGHAGGEVASALAVTSAYNFLKERLAQTESTEIPRLLAEALAAAHSAVFRRASGDPALAEMGTTLEILLVREGKGLLCHVGDSRGYLLREGRLQQLTRDDNLARYLMEVEHVPKEALPADAEHILTQAVGLSDELIPEFYTVELRSGDLILLCSDGLTGMLDDAKIERLLRQSRGDLGLAAAALVASANARGGFDNISVVLVAPEIPPPLLLA